MRGLQAPACIEKLRSMEREFRNGEEPIFDHTKIEIVRRGAKLAKSQADMDKIRQEQKATTRAAGTRTRLWAKGPAN